MEENDKSILCLSVCKRQENKRDSEKNMKATDSEHIGKSNPGVPDSLGEDHHSMPCYQSDTILKSVVEHPHFVAIIS